jgi:hypothetical protein
MSFHSTEVQTITKREEKRSLCVFHYNLYVGGVDKKNQLLQVYLVERNMMNKWYKKLFRILLSARVFNFAM